MLYQETLPKVQILPCANNLLTIGDRQWHKLAATFEKLTLVCTVTGAFFVGCLLSGVPLCGMPIFYGCL